MILYAREFAVNVLGAAVMVSLPYWLGRKLGKDAADGILEKYPKHQPDAQQDDLIRPGVQDVSVVLLCHRLLLCGGGPDGPPLYLPLKYV